MIVAKLISLCSSMPFVAAGLAMLCPYASLTIYSCCALQEKIVPIDDHKLMCLAGEPGDRVQFSEFVIANVKLYALRNDRQLSTHAVAHFTRRELATALRRVGTLACCCIFIACKAEVSPWI